MNSQFVKSLEDRARARHARIGVGIWRPDAGLISRLKETAEYADLLIVGDPSCECDLEHVKAEEPWAELSRLLAEGEIEGAVRGNLPASKAMKALARQFEVRIRRLALMELPGWAFFLAPVGIDEGDTIAGKLELVVEGARFLEGLGVAPKISVLSGGRQEDLGRSERVDRSLAEGELIAARAREAGMDCKHRGILIESCRGDDLLVAPEGISGNLIFRTLLFLCSARALGAPVLMDGVFVDSSRARGDFTGPVMLASAMVAARGASGR